MTADRKQFSPLKADRANSSAHWAQGSNEFPTTYLLFDPHSPLRLQHCAFDLLSELLGSNAADICLVCAVSVLHVWRQDCVFKGIVPIFLSGAV